MVTKGMKKYKFKIRNALFKWKYTYPPAHKSANAWRRKIKILRIIKQKSIARTNPITDHVSKISQGSEYKYARSDNCYATPDE